MKPTITDESREYLTGRLDAAAQRLQKARDELEAIHTEEQALRVRRLTAQREEQEANQERDSAIVAAWSYLAPEDVATAAQTSRPTVYRVVKAADQ